MRKRVGVIFGGRSQEHEISILSAASVLGAINREKYEPVPFAIGKDGAWHLVNTSLDGLTEISDTRIESLFFDSQPVTVADFDEMTDFAFPLLHGPFGEDGTIQGLFEMLGKPYAGCGVAASAVSMDKIFMNEIWSRRGLPHAAFIYTTKNLCCREMIAEEIKRIEKEIPYPIFIKPANMGSSVGISKARDNDELKAAILEALEYDSRIIAEQFIPGREIEIGILGNDKLDVSVVGEIIPEREYYDYFSKYRSSGTKLIIPADIPDGIRQQTEDIAKAAYTELHAEGYARMDLFYNVDEEKVYLNEINTIPGFTRHSMFPTLWNARGVGFEELIEIIIGLGYERYNSANYR